MLLFCFRRFENETFVSLLVRSAFFWFSNDERGKVKAQNPEYGVGDIAKELGRRWADADPEVRSKFEALADKDKIRYEKVSTSFDCFFFVFTSTA